MASFDSLELTSKYLNHRTAQFTFCDPRQNLCQSCTHAFSRKYGKVTFPVL